MATATASASTIRCLDENTIGELFDHRLAQERVSEIDAHVSRCTECRDLLCSLARLYASSSPSRALVQTANLLDVRALASSRLGASLGGGSGSAVGRAGDEANIKRLLALLGCERRLGQVLSGKWRLDAVLGMGGMAEVYSATHLSNGRRVAIKMLRKEWVSKPTVVYRFLREGSVANRINHPGAVSILDDGTTDEGTPFLVLELLEGRTIAAHVRDPERVPTRDALAIASGILDVLAVAHDKKVVHRDIKPENVFLTNAGEVKVLDFGIARMHELTGAFPAGRADASATQQGMMLGTPAYMPPEQARGRIDQIDARADLWAVGATMFALFSGHPVHGGDTPNETLVLAMTKPAAKLGTIVPSLPSEICAIVDKALAFERDDRWRDARAMKAAIDALLGTIASSDTRPLQSLAASGGRPATTAESGPPEGWALGASGASGVPSLSQGGAAKKRRASGSAFTLLGAFALALALTGGLLFRARAVARHEEPVSTTQIVSAEVRSPPPPAPTPPPLGPSSPAPPPTAAEEATSPRAPSMIAEPARPSDDAKSISPSTLTNPRSKLPARRAPAARRAESSAAGPAIPTAMEPAAPPPPPASPPSTASPPSPPPPAGHPLDRRD